MTQLLTVHTEFADMTELANGFVERVDEQSLILPTLEAVVAGEWAQFQLVLADGSVPFSGVGQCSECVDTGEGFDVVLVNIQLSEGMSEVVFERMLVAREQARGAGADPATGELDVSGLEAAAEAEPSTGEIEMPAAEEAEPEPDSEPEPEPVRAAPAKAAAPAPEPKPKKKEAPKPASVLTRPSVGASWTPEGSLERPEARPLAEWFQYGDEGLPKPALPPRPETGAKIDPAPKPAA